MIVGIRGVLWRCAGVGVRMVSRDAGRASCLKKNRAPCLVPLVCRGLRGRAVREMHRIIAWTMLPVRSCHMRRPESWHIRRTLYSNVAHSGHSESIDLQRKHICTVLYAHSPNRATRDDRRTGAEIRSRREPSVRRPDARSRPSYELAASVCPLSRLAAIMP